MQRKRRDLSAACEAGRSQSPHSTDMIGSKPVMKSPTSKTGSRDGGQEGGDMKAGLKQGSTDSANVAKEVRNDNCYSFFGRLGLIV